MQYIKKNFDIEVRNEHDPVGIVSEKTETWLERERERETVQGSREVDAVC